MPMLVERRHRENFKEQASMDTWDDHDLKALLADSAILANFALALHSKLATNTLSPKESLLLLHEISGYANSLTHLATVQLKK